jgi:hypothetical protein
MMLCRPFLLAALAAGAHAQAPNTLTQEEKAAGWILLFDGKTMSGWDDPSRKNPPGDSWTIEDGALKATRRPKVRQDLFTSANFRDFELTFEWRISPRGNSGLKYRIQDRFFVEEHPDNPALKKFEDRTNYRMIHRLKTPPSGGQEYVIGFEYQVIDNGSPARPGAQHAGSLYDMIPAAKDASRPVGEWNQSRIVIRGIRFEHWLNGAKVVDSSLDSPQAKAGIDKRWGAGSPVAKALLDPKPEGPICLQNHNDEAWFRNIKLRRL